MTNDQLIIEQAKLLGWKPAWSYPTGWWKREFGNALAQISHESSLPLIDANSLRQVMAGLSDGERKHFVDELERDCGRRSMYDVYWDAVNASPHDQLRAVLKVKGVMP